MEYIEKIIDMCEYELKSLAKNDKFKSREEISMADQLSHTVKSLNCLMDMWGDDGYSERGYSYRDGGMSRARKRDARGRYSRDMRYDRRYSRADGKEEYIARLHDAWEEAPDEMTRQSIKRMIDEAERA